MLTERYDSELAKIFRLLCEDGDVVEISGWYCIAQWAHNAICPTNRPIEVADIPLIFGLDQYQSILRMLCLDRYPIIENKESVVELVQLIQRMNFTGNRASLFYAYYLCCGVADTSYFSMQAPALHGAIGCTLIHLCMLCAGDKLGTAEIFDINSYYVYESLQFMNYFSIPYDIFELCWKSVHCCDIPSSFKQIPKIINAAKTYAKYKAPKTLLLDQFAAMKGLDISKIKELPSPLPYIREKLGRRIVESGISSEDNDFLNAVYQISLENPTDVVQSLFFQNRDDSKIESMIVRTEISRLLWTFKRMLIVNPSPMFIVEYSKIENTKQVGQITNQSEVEKQNSEEFRTTFAVADETLSYLYSLEFPQYRFVTINHMNDLSQEFDYVVLIARDYIKRNDLWVAFDKCIDYGRVTALIPQSSITQKDETFVEYLSNNQIHIKTMLEIPEKICNTAPKKKLLLNGRKGSSFCKNMRLLCAVPDRSGEWLVLRKNIYIVSEEILKERMTFAEMLLVAKGRKPPVPRKIETYQFSSEIQIEYSKIIEEGKLVGIKASYREKLRPEDLHRRKKGKRIVKNIEKGLRGSSIEEILSKLEHVVLTPVFSEIIADNLKYYYRENPGQMTLKSLLICCYKTLADNKLSFKTSTTEELFCGPNQVLSNLVSDTCSSDRILEAMEALYGGFDIPKEKWLQLNLLFQTAVDEGLLDRNPMVPLMPAIKSKPKDRLYLLNSLFKKSFFTDEEEYRMMRFLREPIPVPGKRNQSAPRYVIESKWLVAAFSWFEGIKIQEICPLTWGDLSKIEDDLAEMYVSITKYLTRTGSVISNINYGNKKKFRRIALEMILMEMLMERKRYLKEHYGYTDDFLNDMYIMLEEEPFRSRGKKNGRMISLATANRVKRQVIQEAQIPPDIISLLEGEEKITVNFSKYRYDLFEANFRHKAYNYAGFTEGELCHHLGNKGPDTFTEHYCDYGEPWLLYDMVRKLYRWTGSYDLSRTAKRPVFQSLILGEETEFDAVAFANGRTSASMSFYPIGEDTGCLLVELQAKHGLTGKAISYETEE